MSDEELTALWREAGRPWLPGMDTTVGMLTECEIWDDDQREVPRVREYSDTISVWRCSDDWHPEWGNPMTEFAMMCAAERAAGEPLQWLLAWDGDREICVWRALTTDDHTPLATGDRRVTCALHVIIACRKGGA